MKKIIAILVAGATLITTTAFCAAENSDEWKENTGTINLDTMAVTGEGIEVLDNVISITDGGDFTVTGTSVDGMIKVNSEEKVKLRLSGMSLTNTTGPAIYFENTEKGFITISKDTENYLCDGSEYSVEDADAALFSNDDLEIKGSGTLTVSANYKHGIASDDDLKIEEGTVNITSYEHSIKANNTIEILGGTINVHAKTGKGIKAEEELIISNGDITVLTDEDEGIESKGTLLISGGDIKITAGEDGINSGSSSTTTTDTTEQVPEIPDGMPQRGERPEMPQGGTVPPMPEDMPEMPEGMPQRGERPDMGQTPPEMPDFTQMPQDGTMPHRGGNGMGGGFGMIDEETAAAHAITISGGNIYINAAGDGIDSNGNLTISGGKLVIDGPTNSGNGALDSEGTMIISGGEVDILSSMGMMQLPRTGDNQNIISVSFAEKGAVGDVVTLKDKDGNTVAEHTAVKDYNGFIYSSSALTAGEEYTVFVNGELYTTLTLAEGTTSYGKGGGFGMPGGGRGKRPNNMRERIRVTLDDKEIRFETDPIIKNERTLVGFRAILEALGATVTWDEDTRMVTATKEGTTIVLEIGSDKAYVNGKESTLDAAPEIVNDSTLIPVRFVSEQLGMDVGWDDVTRHVAIKSK